MLIVGKLKLLNPIQIHL